MNEMSLNDEQLQYGERRGNQNCGMDVSICTSAKTRTKKFWPLRPKALRENGKHIMAITTQAPQTQAPQNDLSDLIGERIDSLAALITVSSEQMDDRLRAEQLLEEDSNRTDELVSLVFGKSTPSIENYLAAQSELQAA